MIKALIEFIFLETLLLLPITTAVGIRLRLYGCHHGIYQLGVIEIMFANYKTYAFLIKEEGEQYIAFVLIAPNPTSRYVIVLDKNKEVKEEIKNYSEWRRINISSTEAMRKIISLGIN